MTLNASNMLIGTRDIMWTNVSAAIWLIDDFSKKKTTGYHTGFNTKKVFIRMEQHSWKP